MWALTTYALPHYCAAMREDDSFRLFSGEEVGKMFLALLAFMVIFWPYFT